MNVIQGLRDRSQIDYESASQLLSILSDLGPLQFSGPLRFMSHPPRRCSPSEGSAVFQPSLVHLPTDKEPAGQSDENADHRLSLP